MRILVIDDESFALRLVSHQLRTLGFHDILPFERAAEAVAFLETDGAGVDAILLDLQMPELDGIEVVRHLARLRYAGGVILVSGEDERILQTASTLAKAHALNVRGAVRKPVTPEQLKHLLEAPHGPAVKGPRPSHKTYAPEDIRRAIDDGQLVNYYQPKVDLATGRVVGVETLVRWQHPEDGLVFPDQFIPQAEEHHLIDALTRFVLRGALRQARVWQDAGYAITVAVNVSMDNLSSLDFPDFVEAAVRAAGVPNDRLILEVTESRLMTNALTALDILTRLRLKHIGLSIDDFGTGHSSLAQLRDVPFAELKIDRGFVHGAARDLAARAIVEASLGMARQLGLTSVAEGVEDCSDWEQMRALGCDVAQGYLIARPMPADRFHAWHADWDKDKHRLLLG